MYSANEAPIIKQCPYLNTFQYLLKLDMPAKATYTLVVTASEKRSKYTSLNFTLHSYSIFPIVLEKAKEELPFKVSVQGEWTTDLSGGSWSYRSYLDNPRYSLKVHQKADIFKFLLFSPVKAPMNIRMFLETDTLSRDLERKREIVSSGEYKVGQTSAKTVYVEPGEYTIVVSLFEPGITGPFTLTCRSSSSFELTPPPSINAGHFSRRCVVQWNNSARAEVAFSVSIKSKAYFSVIAIPDNEEDADTKETPESMSFYRPHMRFSIFNKTSGDLLKTNNEFTDNRLGIYLECISLSSGVEYVCLVERMECGTGQFKIQVYSETPVIFA